MELQADSQSIPSLDWLSTPPQSGLPVGFRLLCVAANEPSWIGLALRLDGVGCHDSRLKWVSTSSEAMTVLRNEVFDVIVLAYSANNGHSEGDLVNLLHAIRASGCEDAIVLLTSQPNDSLTAAACDANAEILVSSAMWDSKALVPCIQRGLRQCELRRENHRLSVANHRRLVRERDEADHLLQQQRDIVKELELLTGRLSAEDDARVFDPDGLAASGVVSEPNHVRLRVPDEIKTYYQELLRTYVIMGNGNLGSEIVALSQVLAKIGLSPRETLSLHLERVEQLVRGLGNRSTRHVMARADLLVLELIMHIGECYQHQAQDEPAL